MLQQTTSKAAIADLDGKLEEQLAANAAASAAAAEAVESSCKAGIAELKADLKEQKEEADAAVAATVEIAATWMFVTNPIHPTNRRESVASDNSVFRTLPTNIDGDVLWRRQLWFAKLSLLLTCFKLNLDGFIPFLRPLR